MAKFAAVALVALVAFQACSARHVLKAPAHHVLKASDSVVNSTYDAAFEVVDQTATQLFDAVYDASLVFTNFVRDVESAVVFEDIDPDMYGDPEVAAEKALADIDAAVASTSKSYGDSSDAAIAKITDIVAQASAGVQDESVLSVLNLIQQLYSQALAAAADIASDFSENAAEVAREAIDERPDIREVRVMEDLRTMYKLASKSIERKVNKAGEQIDAAIAKL